MHPTFRTFLNDTIRQQTGNQLITWEPNRLYAIRPVPASISTDAMVPALADGGWVNAADTDLSNGQVLWFRTDTTLQAGDLPITQEWLNDNIVAGQLNLTNIRFAIYDFGVQAVTV